MEKKLDFYGHQLDGDVDEDADRTRQLADAMRGLREKDEVIARVAFAYENDIQAARVIIPGLGLRECLLNPLYTVLPEQEIVVEPLHDNLGRYRYVRHSFYNGENDWIKDLADGKIPDIETPSGALPGLRIPNFNELLQLLWVAAEGGPGTLVENPNALVTMQSEGDPEIYEWFLKPKQDYRKVYVGGSAEATEEDPSMDGMKQTSFGVVWDRPQTYGKIAWNSDRYRTRRMLRFAGGPYGGEQAGRCAGSVPEFAQFDKAYYWEANNIPELFKRETADTPDNFRLGQVYTPESADAAGVGYTDLNGNVYVLGSFIHVEKSFVPGVGTPYCGNNSYGGAFTLSSPFSGGGGDHEWGLKMTVKGGGNRGYQGLVNLAQAPIEILSGAHGGVFGFALYDNEIVVGTSMNFFSIGEPTGSWVESGEGWHHIGTIANGSDSPTIKSVGPAIPSLPGGGGQPGAFDGPRGVFYTGVTAIDVRVKSPDAEHPDGTSRLHQKLLLFSTLGLNDLGIIPFGYFWEDLDAVDGPFGGIPMGGYDLSSTSGYALSNANDMWVQYMTFLRDGEIVRHYPLDYPSNAWVGGLPNKGFPGEAGWIATPKRNPDYGKDEGTPKYIMEAHYYINVPGIEIGPNGEAITLWDDPTKTKWYRVPLSEATFPEDAMKEELAREFGVPTKPLGIFHGDLEGLTLDHHTQYYNEKRLLALLKTLSLDYFVQPDTTENAKIDPMIDTKGTGPGPEWPLEEYTYLGGFSGHQIITASRYDRTPPLDASVVAYNADNTREWLPVVDRRGDTMTGPLIVPDPQSSTDRLIIAQRLTPLPTPTVLYDHSGHERNGTILGGEYAVWQKPSLLTGAGPDAASVLLNGQTYFLTPALDGLVTYTIEIHFAWFSTGISPGGLLGTPNHYLGVSGAGMDDELHEPYPGPIGGSGYFTYSTFGNPVEHDGQPDPPPDDYPYVGELRPVYGGGDSIIIPHNMIAIVANGIDSFRTFQLSTLRGGRKRMIEAPGYTPAALTNMAFGAIYNGTDRMSGYLSEIIVWDRALSGNEVYGNYQYGGFTTGTQWEDRIRESNPYAWYRFQEGTREAIEGEIEFDTNYLYTHPVAPDVANGYRKVFTAPIEGVVVPGRYSNPVITLNDTGNVIGIETSTDFVGDDDFTAQIDGEKWTFQTSDFFEPGSLEVVYNGLELRPLIDFTEWRTRDGFDLDINIPTVGDSLYVRYTIGTGNDVALGITPTVSYGYPQGAADLANLTDGDDTSFGALPSTLPGAMQLDLGAQKTIFRLRLYAASNPRRAKRGSILYSTNGTNWITLIDYDGVTANERIYEVPFIKARYWRVIVTDLDDVGNSIRWYTWSIYAVDE